MTRKCTRKSASPPVFRVGRFDAEGWQVSHDRPPSGKHSVGRNALRKPLLKIADELVALFDDLILDPKDLQSLAALLAPAVRENWGQVLPP